MKKIKTAILGAGGMGSLHAKNLVNIEGVEICAVCDIVLSVAENLAAQLKCRAYESLDKMLSENEIDAVFICIPPGGHSGEFEKIAAKKIHIFIEKPINICVGKAKSMVEAATENKIYSQVGYMNRFGTAIKELKRRIDLDLTGKPVLFTGSFQCNSLHSPWWRDKTQSGSQVLEQVIHTYDLAMYLFGGAEKISAYMANICHEHVENYTVEDVSAAIVNFKNGALGSVSASNCAIPGRWDNHFTVVYENLTAQFTSGNNAIFTETSGGETKTFEINDSQNNMYAEEAKYFIETIRGEKENICTISDGYDSLCFVDAVARSAQTGNTVIL